MAQSPSGENALTDEKISRQLTRQMGWEWFWYGPTIPDYAEGKSTQMAIMESPREVAVFVAEIGWSVVFDLNGEIIGGRRFPPTRNEDAINEYLRTYTDTPASFASFLRQVEPDAQELAQKRATFTERSLSFVLPKLEPPDYILVHQVPSELSRLESAVRTEVSIWYDPTCGSGELLIPYFSADHPVFVYADLGMCDKGILDFRFDESGQWRSGKLWPDRPPHDWSHTIQRIRNNLLSRILLPLESK